MVEQGYQISVCERPVIRGQKFDISVLGKPLSHPYLVLKSPDEVIGEIHGTWERAEGYKQTRLAKSIELSIAFASVVGQEANCCMLFNKVSFGQNPVNVVRSYEGEKQYSRAFSEIPVLNGNDEVLDIWDHAKYIAEKISALKIPYARYGGHGTVNCQTTLRTVMRKAFIPRPDSDQFSLSVPGWYGREKINPESINSALSFS